MLAVAVSSLLPFELSWKADAQLCTGDCDGDQVLAIDELITGVTISLSSSAPSACPQFDANADGAVGISDLVAAVEASLGTCPNALQIPGRCLSPDEDGLGDCRDDTVIRVRLCDNPTGCTDDPELVILNFGRVANGAFTLTVDRRMVENRPLVFEAEIEPATPTRPPTTYRVIEFGPIGPNAASVRHGAGAGALVEVLIDPSAEAATRLLDERNLSNFAPDGVRAVVEAVREANPEQTFAARAPGEAAEQAESIARIDADVQNALETTMRPPSNVTIRVGTAVGPPTSTARFSVSLTTVGMDVVGVENRIAFDPLAPVGVVDGAPDCEVNPDIGKDATSFSFQPPGCTPSVDCEEVKVFVLAIDNLDPIPDGAVLYTCTVEGAAEALAGQIFPLTCRNPKFSGADGPIPAPAADCTDGQVVLRAL